MMEEPILSRIDRLNIMLMQLEKNKECSWSPRSSCVSTLTSDGGESYMDFSMKNLEEQCRPIDSVLKEAEVKGTMVERLDHIEERLLKLEEEVEVKKKREEKNEKRLHRRGIKKLVKQCVRF